MVAVGTIVPDPKVNRELNTGWVARIAGDFTEDLLGVLVVWGRHDGTFTPIMGQHRAAAALQAKGPDYEVRCEVRRDLNEREACDLFLRSSHVLAIPAIEKFHKAVTAGWQTEVSINKAIQGAGCRVSNDKRPRSIRGVQPMYQAYKWGGAALVTRTVRVAVDAFGEETEALSTMVLGGIARTLSSYGDLVEDADIVERLQRITGGPAGVHAQARLLQQVQGGDMGRAVANVIVSHINKGRRGKGRLEQLT
jgi:hypothetical protein